MSKRKKYSGLDPAVARVMTAGAVENKAALTKKQRRDRQRTRALYDVAPVVKNVVDLVAKREDTSASQIGEVLLAYGLRAYLRGDAELQDAMSRRETSKTLRFSWNLRMPDEWMLALEAHLSEAQKPKKWGV